MSEQADETVILTSQEKKALRSLGHHLEPMVYVGKEGMSPALLNSLQAALTAHELIKIKIGQNCPVERNQAGQELTRRTGAALVQVIGRMLLLYRPNPDLPEARRISLTSGSSIHHSEKIMQKTGGRTAARTKRP
ncbi:MAG: ribosome assembly RNA-binding protein YhbY [Desulfobulbus sp.]|nr:ribosome assembly RNA-binding protein YhbY [Desulfobulbus sp.]